MSRDTNMEFFAEAIKEICAHSPVAPGRPLRWVVITNPTAGGFAIKSRWKKTQRMLEECRAAARANPLREDYAPAGTVQKYTEANPGTGNAANPIFTGCGLIFTKGPGCAAEIAAELVNEASTALNSGVTGSAAPFYLIITAGGDGTSLEVQSVLYQRLGNDAPAALHTGAAILRLPLGTGNDGADSPDLAAALKLLIKPSRIEHVPALRLLTAPDGPASRHAGGHADAHVGIQGPYLAFNILSVGLDAFVTHMTNKMKGKLPGDFYKLWVDIASLLYDKLYTVGNMDVRALDEQGNENRSFREKVLLLAVGASGRRTYGSQKKILPDDRNVCIMKQMPLLRKVALKGLFNTGEHIDKPEAILFNAHRVEFSGEHPILAQMDGEAILLHREDFPAAIELTEPIIPVLKRAD